MTLDLDPPPPPRGCAFLVATVVLTWLAIGFGWAAVAHALEPDAAPHWAVSLLRNAAVVFFAACGAVITVAMATAGVLELLRKRSLGRRRVAPPSPSSTGEPS